MMTRPRMRKVISKVEANLLIIRDAAKNSDADISEKVLRKVTLNLPLFCFQFNAPRKVKPNSVSINLTAAKFVLSIENFISVSFQADEALEGC